MKRHSFLFLGFLIVLLVFSFFSFVPNVYAASTTWYFRNVNASVGPTAKASTDTDSFPTVPADKNTPKVMFVTKGSAQTSVAGAYSTSTTPLYTMARIFVGPALSAQTLTGGQAGYKVATAIKESNTLMNLFHRVFVYVWRSGSGNVKTLFATDPVSCGTEHGNTEVGCVITAAGAAGDFSILANDRIVVEEWFDIRNTKATSYTATFYYDGITDPVDGTANTNSASYFLCPQTLTEGYTGSASQSITTSLSTSRLTETLRSAAQSVTMSLSGSRLIEITRPTAQAIGIALTGTRQFDITRMVSQTISFSLQGIGETVVEYLREAILSITVALSTSRLFDITRTVSQGVSIGLATTRVAEFSRSVTQTITAALGVQRLAEWTKTVSQAIGVTLGMSRMADFFRSIAQSITVGLSTVRLAEFMRGLSQAITVSLSSSKLTEITRAVSQSISISIQALGEAALTYIRNVALAIITSVNGQRLAEIFKQASQNIGVSMFGSRVAEFTRSASQTIPFTLQGIGETITIYFRDVVLSITTTLTSIRLIDITRQASQALGFLFNGQRLIKITRLVSQTIHFVSVGFGSLFKEFARLAALSLILTGHEPLFPSLPGSLGVFDTSGIRYIVRNAILTLTITYPKPPVSLLIYVVAIGLALVVALGLTAEKSMRAKRKIRRGHFQGRKR